MKEVLLIVIIGLLNRIWPNHLHSSDDKKRGGADSASLGGQLGDAGH